MNICYKDEKILHAHTYMSLFDLRLRLLLFRSPRHAELAGHFADDRSSVARAHSQTGSCLTKDSWLRKIKPRIRRWL
jgi:hypothetical protein